jgi:hypothetical protein|tara:strand:- start:1048 stop:1317 length:270 start_codon:yes stop_codon:yes gene_type:complete
MKVTNNEYETIIRSLNAYRDILKINSSSIEETENSLKEVYSITNKLRKEYNRIAEMNIASGMTTDEEELYPSKVYDEYGGAPNENKEVE